MLSIHIKHFIYNIIFKNIKNIPIIYDIIPIEEYFKQCYYINIENKGDGV